MAIGDGSSNGNQQSARKEIRDETTPLLPVKVEEDDGFHEFNGASFSGAVFNLSTTIVGAGIMALPASIKMLGIIPGILMIIIVALLTEASIDMLVRCSHQGKITSYGWLMGEVFGQWGRIALQASIIINNVGVLIVYMIIIGSRANKTMEREIMSSYETKKCCEIRVFESSDEMATDLAEFISQVSEISVKERGYFAIALCGGPLIRHMQKLCEAPYSKTLDWSKWYIFWAEERAVAKNHAESNYKLAKEGFLSKVPILNGHVYSINDNATVEQAATDYEFVIRQLVKVRTVGVSESNDCPKFDLILLNIGPDGHVASLFPNHPALELKDDWVTYITDSPEPPPERITFTLPVINSALNIAIVATGEDKEKAVSFAISDCNESLGATSVPATMVQPTDGKLVWFLDEAAASSLEAGNDAYEHQY